jgi:hypothetical protein
MERLYKVYRIRIFNFHSYVYYLRKIEKSLDSEVGLFWLALWSNRTKLNKAKNGAGIEL